MTSIGAERGEVGHRRPDPGGRSWAGSIARAVNGGKLAERAVGVVAQHQRLGPRWRAWPVALELDRSVAAWRWRARRSPGRAAGPPRRRAGEHPALQQLGPVDGVVHAAGRTAGRATRRTPARTGRTDGGVAHRGRRHSATTGGQGLDARQPRAPGSGVRPTSPGRRPPGPARRAWGRCGRRAAARGLDVEAVQLAGVAAEHGPGLVDRDVAERRARTHGCGATCPRDGGSRCPT